MKAALVLSLLWIAGDPDATVAVLRARYAYSHATRPALPDSLGSVSGTLPSVPDTFSPGAPMSRSLGSDRDTPIALDRDAIAAALAHPQRKLIVYSQPFSQCPPCRALFDAVGEGDANLHVKWVKANLPVWVTATPTIYDPATNQYRTGVHSLAELHRWTGTTVVEAARTPPVVGVIRGQTLDGALEALRTILGDNNTLRLEGGRTVPLGQLEVVLASPTTIRWNASDATQQITFDGTKPVLRAWGMQVTCDGIVSDGRTVTVQIPRFPDWSLRVE